jgi:hypothetical protein
LKPKLIALNLLLVAAVSATVWQARVRWQAAEAERKATLNVPIRAAMPGPVPAVPKPDSPPATKYADVAEKNLFSVDRNPAVIIDPPKPVEVKPMPHLPVVFGTMGLPSGIKAIMAEKPGEASRSVRAGDTIGEFKVLAIDTQKIRFEWDGKEIEKRIEDLVDRSNVQTAGARGPAAPPPSGPAAPAPQPPQAQSNANPTMSVELTEGVRACKPGENSPAGTMLDGYKKTITMSPFGATCRWTKQ